MPYTRFCNVRNIADDFMTTYVSIEAFFFLISQRNWAILGGCHVGVWLRLANLEGGLFLRGEANRLR